MCRKGLQIIIYLTVYVLSPVAVFAGNPPAPGSPPPPPNIPIDTSLFLFLILAVFFGLYVVHIFNKNTSITVRQEKQSRP